MPYSTNNSERFDHFDEECHVGFFQTDKFDMSKIRAYLLAHSDEKAKANEKIIIDKSDVIAHIDRLVQNKNFKELHEIITYAQSATFNSIVL